MRGLGLMAATWALGAIPFALGGRSAIEAAFLGGAYAFTALTALLLARAVLALAVNVEGQGAALFDALRGATDPLLALWRWATPDFLTPWARALHAAALTYLVKLFLFGGLGIPPLFILLYVLVAAR